MEYLLELPNFIDEIVCKDIIRRFEKDENKFPGKVGNGVVNKNIKVSTDLHISSCDKWKDVDSYIHAKISEGIDIYKEHVRKITLNEWNDSWCSELFGNTSDTGYQIQRVDKGGFYVWHHDGNFKECRNIAVLFYLNTLNEDEGGTTDFKVGHEYKKIRPEAGKLIFFPTSWPYLHTGKPVLTDKKSKYIVTSFLINNTFS